MPPLVAPHERVPSTSSLKPSSVNATPFRPGSRSFAWPPAPSAPPATASPTVHTLRESAIHNLPAEAAFAAAMCATASAAAMDEDDDEELLEEALFEMDEESEERADRERWVLRDRDLDKLIVVAQVGAGSTSGAPEDESVWLTLTGLDDGDQLNPDGVCAPCARLMGF